MSEQTLGERMIAEAACDCGFELREWNQFARHTESCNSLTEKSRLLREAAQQFAAVETRPGEDLTEQQAEALAEIASEALAEMEPCPTCDSLGYLTEEQLAAVETREAQLQALVEKWLRRSDRGFDPEEELGTTAFWHGVRRCADELSQVLAEHKS